MDEDEYNSIRQPKRLMHDRPLRKEEFVRRA